MATFDHDAHREEVLASFQACPDARFRQIMESAVCHLHGFVAEVQPSVEEWFQAIQFLTQTGQICTDKRQEFILLSDLLGVSTLVVGLNQHREEGCLEETVEGPYYWAGAPEQPIGADLSIGVPGEKAYYAGHVLDEHGRAIANAVVDVWSGDGEGNYDMQAGELATMQSRAIFRTDQQGRYAFWSIKPKFYPIPTDGPAGRMQARLGRHPNRPGHIHFKLRKDGFHPINTQLFIANGPYLDSDCVFGVKQDLIVDYQLHPAGMAPDGTHREEPFYTVQFDFRLTPDSARSAVAA